MKHSEYLGIKMIENEDGISFIFEVDEKHLNDHGTVHGGVLFSICSEAVAMHVALVEKRDGVGAEGSIHYYRPAALGDKLSITVIPRKNGKRMSNYLIEIKNQNGKLLADSMFTVVYIDA